ncbi:modular serine protease-like isoform X1 [Vespula squamosa]|uniref:Modular serine protease-like isoform X1 n=1 Tax=Vespula squamosa TaxID=30214 RepID=A0ABD2B2M2_VESSQ
MSAALVLAILSWGKIINIALSEQISSNSTTIFICTDGSQIPLINVCDGSFHCPDSSDETSKLCQHILCPSNMYRCAYGACVIRTSRCDGIKNCVDESDEARCDFQSNETCSDREYQCSTSRLECIPITDICNGYIDCSDKSDEDVSLCREYFCPDHTYRCSYGGCVYQEVLCDGIKDCFDGTDEDPLICGTNNCNGIECPQYECRQDEFACENERQCIPITKICDGVRHCRDASDENSEMCIQRECRDDHYRCFYGACIPIEFICNLRPDCYDWSDEDEVLCGTILPESACRLPGPKIGTHYKTRGCSRCRPGEVVPEFTRLDYTCDADGWLEGSNSIYCQNNRWLPSIPICSNNNDMLRITCPPILETNGAIKRCESKWGPRKGWISCENSVPIGTNAFIECPMFYERQAGSPRIVCLHDGTWSQAPLSCIPVCGIRKSSTRLIVNGWKVQSEEYMPWQATLFSHENGQWRFFCGGTLIGERVVLTAGHCVWKTLPETIRVAFGILSNTLDNVEANVQVLDIDKIEIQNSYQDHEGNYASDIALLILKMPVKINEIVRPACIDLQSDFTLVEAQKNGDSGFVAGMGITENDTYSSTLRITSMTVISNEKCHEAQRKDFRKYITYTSFCAGWANGTGVCNGDSGGGFILRRPNTAIWEVHGVVSISPRRLGTSICDPYSYAVFTKVSLYGDWIRNIIEKIPPIGPSDIHWQPNKDDIII